MHLSKIVKYNNAIIKKEPQQKIGVQQLFFTSKIGTQHLFFTSNTYFDYVVIIRKHPLPSVVYNKLETISDCF